MAQQNIPYGKRLVPSTIDKNAQEYPEKACFSIPKSSNAADGFRDISCKTFANAIDNAAWFIEEKLGKPRVKFETFMYMGVADLRYYIVLVAAIKTGYKVLFSSHINSVAGHVDLLQKTSCTTLLYSSGFPVEGIVQAHEMRTFVFPELEELLSSQAKPYAYNKSYEEACNDPVVIVHTSGSTGLPKPIVRRHSALRNIDAHHLIPPLEDGRETFCAHKGVMGTAERAFIAAPLFHGSGLTVGIAISVFIGKTSVLPPPGPITPEVFGKMIDHADAACCIPLTLDRISRVPAVVEKLDKLKYIIYVGGHISQAAGEIISKRTYLMTTVASVETGALVCHRTDPPDWNYVCFSPYYNGIQWRPASSTSPSDSNLYELVIVKDPSLSLFQSVFDIYPEQDEYPMRDLYSAHPSKPHHWKHEGRKDDMIVFASGTNFHPAPRERIINEHPAVKSCLVVGDRRCAPAALVELHAPYASKLHDEQGRKAMLQALQPKLDEVNRTADSVGQLSARRVLFASPEKPFLRAGKETVQRKATVELYAEEIEQLYEQAG